MRPVTGSLVDALPDGLLLDARGGGRVMLAIAVVVFVALALGASRGAPRRGTLVIVAGALAGGAIGAWLVDGLATGTLVPVGLSLLGAAIGGPLGAALAARAIGVDVWVALDRLAVPGLIGAALARSGCLLAGCDFGRAAPDALFAVRYAAGTPPFGALVARGELSAHASMTGPLHAFPLYEVALVAIGTLALVVIRRRLAPGAAAALAATLYFTARACAEAFRHGAPSPPPLVFIAGAGAVFGIALALRLQSQNRPGVSS